LRSESSEETRESESENEVAAKEKWRG